MGDVHGATVIKNVGQKLPERWASGDGHQNYACPDALTALPPSPSFPHSPPDLVLLFHGTQAASLYSGPLSLDARLIEAFLLDRCTSYAVVPE